MNALRLLGKIKEKRWLFFISFSFTLSIALLLAQILPAQYESSAKWLVKRATTNTMISGSGSVSRGNALSEVAGLLLSPYASNQPYIDAAVLESPEVLRTLIKRANLLDPFGKPESIDTFKKRFSVSVDKNNPFLILKYHSSTPGETYRVLTLAEEIFIENNISAEAKKAQLNKLFLKKEVDKATNDLQNASNNLKSFEEQTNVISADEEAILQQKRLSTTEVDLNTLKARLAASRSKITTLKSTLKLPSITEAMNYSVVSNDAAINALLTTLSDKKLELIDLQAKYTSKHPALIALQESINELESQINAKQVSLIGKKLPISMLSTNYGVKKELISQLITEAKEMEGLQNQLNTISGTVNDYEYKLASLPEVKNSLDLLNFNTMFQQSRVQSLKSALESAQLSESFAKNAVSIVKLQEPVILENPTFPNIWIHLVLGVVGGLCVATMIVFAASYFDTTIDTLEDVEHTLGIPSFGQFILPKHFSVQSVLQNTLIEDFNKLRTNIKLSNIDEQKKVIGLVSPEVNVAADILLFGLAHAYAQIGQKVLVIDTNYRHSALEEFDVENGLTELVIENGVALRDYIKPYQDSDKLFILPCGAHPPDPTVIFESQKMQHLIQSVKEHFDQIFLNLPAFNPYADDLILSKYLNTRIIVAQRGITKYSDLIKLRKSFSQNNFDLHGCLYLYR